MFFNEEEMKIAEDLAWKMLDGWKHAFMPNLKIIEDYLVNLFLFRPEWAPEIADKIKKNLNNRINGREVRLIVFGD